MPRICIKNSFRPLLNAVVILCAMLLAIQPLGSDKVLTKGEAKAYYIIEIARHLVWPNESKIKQFKIGIIGEDQELSETLNRLRSLKIRKKDYSVETIDASNFNLNNYSIIFITETHQSVNALLFPKVKNSLIIVEQKHDDHQLLISLVTENNFIAVKLNRANLISRGFEVSSKLLELVGTKKDLGEQLRARESSLAKLHNQVADKERELAEISQIYQQNKAYLEQAQKSLSENKKALVKNKLELDNTKQELSAQKQQLATLIGAIEKSQRQIESNTGFIDKQQSKLDVTQDKLKDKERAIVELQIAIDKNEKVLVAQNRQIAEKIEIIGQRESTIDWQKNLLVVTGLFLLTLLVMSYHLYKANKHKNSANNELALLNSQLYELATTDGMTKLYNRRFFLESAQKELQRQSRKSFNAVLVMIDIDFFKSVNDSHGHVVGDEVIKTIAQILKNGMRKYDLVGRMGGEEFAMMLTDCDIKVGQEVAERIRDVTSKTKVIYGEVNIGVTISLGMSQLTESDINIEFPIVRADKALYIAKDSGRNQVVVYEESIEP